MNNNDMRQPPSRCSSTSSIVKNSSRMPNGDQQPAYYNGKYPSDYYRQRTSFHSAAAPPARKEVTNSIFSFLQRFRAKNRSIFDDVNSLPSSPSSTRLPRPAAYRWESVESILSSATTTSFAFIPSYQQQPSARSAAANSSTASHLTVDNRSARENCAFLRKKYNLHGSDATLYHQTGDTAAGAFAVTTTKSAKKLHRNSTGNVESLATHWPNDCYPSFYRYRPHSEANNTLHIRQSHCHRPGKRRAPQPPTAYPAAAKTHRRPSAIRKKRKAPSPPKNSMADDRARVEPAGFVCNDSLKLERGVLKANKESIASPATTESISVPVSPKPWYKRSSTQPNLKSVSKSVDKKKSCEQLLDEWMLEAGLPRSTSFYERKLAEPLLTSASSSESGNPKRRSQISMLANISELDREAAEIVQQERKREREVAHSLDVKFYDGTGSVEEAPAKVPESGNATSKRTASKDLISILNAITNVTRITANTHFFKETISKSASSSAVPDMKLTRSVRSPDKPQSDRLTITEQDQPKEIPKSPAPESNTVIQSPPPEASAAPPTESIKPVKPFSNWMCPQCTLENPSWKFICEACNKWRPYSVNRPSSSVQKITPKEDMKLKLWEKQSPAADDIPENIRLQVYNKLVSQQNSTNHPSDNHVQVQSTSSSAPMNVDETSLSSDAKFYDKIEQVRKARLAFFTKNRLNDLSSIDDEKIKPSNANNAENNSKCYSEDDRRRLREILKELKDSLPKTDLHGEKSMKRKITVHSARDEAKAAAGRPKVGTKMISNSDTCHNSTKKEKAEAYFITTKTVIPELSSSSSKITNAVDITDTNREKVELNVSVVENVVQNDESVRTKANKAVEILIRNKDIQPEQSKTRRTEGENVRNLVEMAEQAEKQEQNDGILVAEGKQNNSLTSKENRNLTAVTVNRLLKKLQTAIASGQHHEAANIARDLARLKVNCNMSRQDAPEIPPVTNVDDSQIISIDIHMQEKNVPRDPIRLKINPQTTITELQTKVFKEHGIPVANQQFIFGKHPVMDTSATLDQLGVNSNGMIMFLKIIKLGNTDESNSTGNKPVIDHLDEEKPSTSVQHFIKVSHNIPKPSTSAANDLNTIVVPIPTTQPLKEENKSLEMDRLPVENARIIKISHDMNNLEAEPVQSENKEPIETPDWVCSVCTLINEKNAKMCAACGRLRQEITTHTITDDVESKTSSETKNETPATKPTNYSELMDLEKTDLIANVDAFECAVCLALYNEGDGVVLRDCLHTFCRDCLSQTVEHCAEAEVKCPFRDAEYSCESVLQEREIKTLVSAETFEKHLARSVAEAENKIQNTFHCKTANCQGWCIFEDNVNEFHCPVCSKTNCLTCQVIHSGLNCKQYQEVINKESGTNADANRTKLMLQEMLQKGEAITCPTCEIILMKKWGCDWLRCSMCKTEICWVTRGPRWGPKGKGDTSGGCRCGVNGVKCHQKCTFCH